MSVEPGRLVVVPKRPELGVGRLDVIYDAPGPGQTQRARVFFYDEGQLLVFEVSDLEPCPPGVWNKST